MRKKTLEEMGHPQPRTPIQTDNSTAFGAINNKIQPKQTKSMNMHWLRCRDTQGQFRFYWMPEIQNWAEYLDQAPQRPTSQRHEARISDQRTSCACTESINQENACGSSSSLSLCEGVLEYILWHLLTQAGANTHSDSMTSR